jgi:hypothetical protein
MSAKAENSETVRRGIGGRGIGGRGIGGRRKEMCSS